MKIQAPKRELNYLLITPRISPYPYPQNFEKLSVGNMPVVPPGFAYISASLKRVERKVFNLNLELEPDDAVKVIEKAVSERKADVVLTTGLSRHFTMIKQVVDTVKRMNPEIVVVVGGGVISSNPEVAMNAFGQVDIGVIGEGEVTIQELAAALRGDRELSSVGGLVYRENGKYVGTLGRSEIVDLDALPLPDYEGLEYGKFCRQTGYVNIVCGRSCPFNCTFCFHPCGKIYRARSIGGIVREIEYLVNEFKIRSINLIGEGLFFKHQESIELCERLKPLQLAWGCTMHPSRSNMEVLRHMKESGCKTICIGIESACDHILKSMNKKSNFKVVEKALREIQESGIQVSGNFIFGDVLEDQESVETTIGWWRKNRRFPIDLIMIMGYPGTGMYKVALQKGLITNEEEYLRNNCPNINLSQLSDQQYRELEMRLSTEKAFYTYAPRSYSIVSADLAARRTLAKYSCECGHSAEISTKGILVSDSFACPACAREYQIPFHEMYSSAFSRDIVKGLVEHGRKVACWGIGIEMQLLLRMIDLPSLDGVFLIDREVKKQGLRFMNQAICAPDILRSQEIDTVIVTPIAQGAVNDTITWELQNLQVKKIIQFSTLLKQVGVCDHLG